MSGGFISFDQAMLDTKPKPGSQGLVVGKDPVIPEPESVEIPTERLTGQGGSTADDIPKDDTAISAQDGTPMYRSTREMPLQHSGVRGDGTEDADITPPRRPGSANTDKAKSSKKSKPDKPQGPTVQIRDFPRSLMAVARAEFPDASNNTDALAAYVLAKSGKSNLDVPESVSELVHNWEGDKTLENMEKRISALTGQMAILLSLMQELELLMTFVTFDRLGYRQEMAADVRSVDFLEPGVAELMARVREQSKQMRRQEAIKNGRPIR